MHSTDVGQTCLSDVFVLAKSEISVEIFDDFAWPNRTHSGWKTSKPLLPSTKLLLPTTQTAADNNQTAAANNQIAAANNQTAVAANNQTCAAANNQTAANQTAAANNRFFSFSLFFVPFWMYTYVASHSLGTKQWIIRQFWIVDFKICLPFPSSSPTDLGLFSQFYVLFFSSEFAC